MFYLHTVIEAETPRFHSNIILYFLYIMNNYDLPFPGHSKAVCIPL